MVRNFLKGLVHKVSKSYENKAICEFFLSLSIQNTKITVSKYGMKGIDPKRFGIRIQTLGKVEELKRALFV
jgi:hypothetical protein